MSSIENIVSPFTLSDIQVCPGDIILGDDTGVVVIPQSLAEDVAEIAEKIDQKEREILSLIDQGYSLKNARVQTGYHHLQTKGSSI